MGEAERLKLIEKQQDKLDKEARKAEKEAEGPKPKKAKKEKAEEDPDAKPKKPLSSYMLFMKSFRTEFAEANPEVKGVAEVGKAGGEKWQAMTEEEKKPFVDEALKLKEEYAVAVATWNEAHGVVAPEKKEKEKKEKGPPSAFRLFAQSFQPEYRKNHPGSKLADVSKACGDAWKALSADQKRDFEASAQKAKAEFLAAKAAATAAGSDAAPANVDVSA